MAVSTLFGGKTACARGGNSGLITPLISEPLLRQAGGERDCREGVRSAPPVTVRCSLAHPWLSANEISRKSFVGRQTALPVPKGEMPMPEESLNPPRHDEIS